MKNALTILIASTLLAGTGLAQSQAPTHDLKSAEAFFRKGDRDHDGKLSRAEAGALGISRRQAITYDDNSDGSISKAEFYVAYRQMAHAGGETTGGDLDKEVTRIMAERKAAKERADAEKRKQATKRIESAKDKADAEARAQGEKRIKEAQDKADAKERAEATKRIQLAKDKAAAEARAKAEARKKAEAEKRRKGSGVRPDKGKRPQPKPRKEPAPQSKKKGRIGG